MNNIKPIIKELLCATNEHQTILQKINSELLQNYIFAVGAELIIEPKDVEIYYVNRTARPAYVDSNMHCQLDPQTNATIYNLQSNRYGRFYCHKKGYGGVDICLSDSEDYALCCTIKAATVNGKEYWSSAKIRNLILEAMYPHNNAGDTAKSITEMSDKLNGADAPVVLKARDNRLEEDVYHIRRSGLHRRDATSSLALRSFVDVWNKKNGLTSAQRINLYMNAHPEEDVLELLRRQGFRCIPYEVRIKYHINPKVKLTQPADK